MPQDDGVPAQDWRSVAERVDDEMPAGVERARADPGARLARHLLEPGLVDP